MSSQYTKPAAPPADLGPLFTAPPAPAFEPLAICPIPETEALVHGAIKACQGRKAALSMKAVAEHAGLLLTQEGDDDHPRYDTRTVQTIIAHLIEAHHCPIGSSTSAPHGYYWIVDPEDLARAKTQLSHRIIETAKRLRALDKNALSDVMGQLRMELEHA